MYFALNQPYTYSRLIKYIGVVERSAKDGVKVETKKLGHTLADNVIPAMKIWTETTENKETILYAQFVF